MLTKRKKEENFNKIEKFNFSDNFLHRQKVKLISRREIHVFQIIRFLDFHFRLTVNAFPKPRQIKTILDTFIRKSRLAHTSGIRVLLDSNQNR